MCKMLKHLYDRKYHITPNQISPNDKEHQVLLDGGPNLRQMNRGWRMAAILQRNRYISTTAGPIITTFGIVSQNGPLYHIGR